MSTDALAANWDPEILKAYLDGVEEDRELGAGIDDEEALSTDEEDDLEDESSVSSISLSSDQLAAAHLTFPHSDDITSSDEAFSSEDEFGDDDIRERQLTRRELVLGRPTVEILKMKGREMREMQEGYMKELDDADVEIAELTGGKLVVVQRRRSDEVGQKVDLERNDEEVVVAELRKRSSKEIFETERGEAVRHLVLLAQALFRKERYIKSLRGEDVGENMDSSFD